MLSTCNNSYIWLIEVQRSIDTTVHKSYDLTVPEIVQTIHTVEQVKQRAKEGKVSVQPTLRHNQEQYISKQRLWKELHRIRTVYRLNLLIHCNRSQNTAQISCHYCKSVFMCRVILSGTLWTFASHTNTSFHLRNVNLLYLMIW